MPLVGQALTLYRGMSGVALSRFHDYPATQLYAVKHGQKRKGRIFFCIGLATLPQLGTVAFVSDALTAD